MARVRRCVRGGVIYHVLNRAARKAALFWTEQDYEAFLRVVAMAKRREPVGIFAYIVMPNHWHFLMQPLNDGELSSFMHWTTTTHARRWNIAHDKSGEGAVYQSRFKAIPVQDGAHLLQVWRYVERNALRGHLVRRAEDWHWSSLATPREHNALLDPAPLELPANWIERVNEPQTQQEVDVIRLATDRELPYGDAEWRERFSTRNGRQRKVAHDQKCNGV